LYLSARGRLTFFAREIAPLEMPILLNSSTSASRARSVVVPHLLAAMPISRDTSCCGARLMRAQSATSSSIVTVTFFIAVPWNGGYTKLVFTIFVLHEGSCQYRRGFSRFAIRISAARRF